MKMINRESCRKPGSSITTECRFLWSTAVELACIWNLILLQLVLLGIPYNSCNAAKIYSGEQINIQTMRYRVMRESCNFKCKTWFALLVIRCFIDVQTSDTALLKVTYLQLILDLPGVHDEPPTCILQCWFSYYVLSFRFLPLSTGT